MWRKFRLSKINNKKNNATWALPLYPAPPWSDGIDCLIFGGQTQGLLAPLSTISYSQFIQWLYRALGIRIVQHWNLEYMGAGPEGKMQSSLVNIGAITILMWNELI